MYSSLVALDQYNIARSNILWQSVDLYITFRFSRIKQKTTWELLTEFVAQRGFKANDKVLSKFETQFYWL